MYCKISLWPYLATVVEGGKVASVHFSIVRSPIRVVVVGLAAVHVG